jgi:hypothetical protein
MLITLTGIIQQSFPWFFEMRTLIGECPNVNPTGLGNSATDVDMDSYRTGKSGRDDLSEKLDVEMDTEVLADDEIDEEDFDELVNKEKAQLDAEQTNRKTAARSGKSKPAGRVPKEQKKKRKLEDFAEVAEAEEVTHQKELELAKAMVDKDRAKLEVKAVEMAYKMQKLQDKSAKRKERAKEKASKLCLLEYRQAQGFTMPSIPALQISYNGHHAPSSPFQDSNHITANPQQYPATSSSNHYYWSDAAQIANRSYAAGPSTPSYDDGHNGHSSEVSSSEFNLHGGDGSSSSSGGTAFSDGLDLAQ